MHIAPPRRQLLGRRGSDAGRAAGGSTRERNRGTRPRRRIAALVALVLLALGACEPSPPSAPAAAAPAAARSASAIASSAATPAPVGAESPAPRATIRVAQSSPTGSPYALQVAKAAGYFDEQGLDVELQVLNGPRALVALVAREVEMATSDGQAVVSMAASGEDVVLIATAVNTLVYRLMVAPDVQQPADLRGEKVGITNFGTSSEYTLRRLLEQWGLRWGDDVAPVQMGDVANVFAGLQSGAVQAGLVGPPNYYRAVLAGFNVLVDVTDYGWEYPLGPLSVRREYLDANRPVLLRFLRAYLRGIHRLKTDPEFAKEVARTASRLPDDGTLDAYQRDYARVNTLPPYSSAEALRTALALLRQETPTADRVDPEALIDNSLVAELEAEGYGAALEAGR